MRFYSSGIKSRKTLVEGLSTLYYINEQEKKDEVLLGTIQEYSRKLKEKTKNVVIDSHSAVLLSNPAALGNILSWPVTDYANIKAEMQIITLLSDFLQNEEPVINDFKLGIDFESRNLGKRVPVTGS